MKKKIIVTLLTALMSLNFVGCGAEKEVESDKYVAVICKGKEHEFWQAVEKGVIDAGEEMNIKTTFTAPENETQIDVQIELINEAIEEGADAILVAPLDTDALNSTLRTADEKGIPIITFDSDVTYSGRKANIGTENTTAGAIAAREAVNLIGKSGQIGIIKHGTDTQTALERTGGFVDTIENYEYLEIVDTRCSEGGNIDKAKEEVTKMLTETPTIKLIYATNEGCAVGACEAVESMGLAGKVKIIGFDSSSAEIKYIENGTLNGMVVQNPYNMGYLGVRYSSKLIDGEALEDRINTGATYVNKDNLNEEDIELLLYPMGKQG